MSSGPSMGWVQLHAPAVATGPRLETRPAAERVGNGQRSGANSGATWSDSHAPMIFPPRFPRPSRVLRLAERPSDSIQPGQRSDDVDLEAEASRFRWLRAPATKILAVSRRGRHRAAPSLSPIPQAGPRLARRNEWAGESLFGLGWWQPTRALAEGFFEFGRHAAHLVGDARGVKNSAHGARGDQEQEFRLFEPVLDGAKEVAEDRDAAQPGDADPDSGAAVLDEATQNQRLVVQEHHRGLGLALGEARRVDGRGLVGTHIVDLLPDVEGHRALLADAG